MSSLSHKNNILLWLRYRISYKVFQIKKANFSQILTRSRLSMTWLSRLWSCLSFQPSFRRLFRQQKVLLMLQSWNSRRTKIKVNCSVKSWIFLLRNSDCNWKKTQLINTIVVLQNITLNLIWRAEWSSSMPTSGMLIRLFRIVTDYESKLFKILYINTIFTLNVNKI